jgi:hypothetical protein
VHLKPNQQLKYLNKGSVHTNACFKAILDGVHKRLAKLTTITDENKNKKLDEAHPLHFKALKHAGLVTEKIPTLEEELPRIKTTKTDKDKVKAKEESDRNRRRATFFVLVIQKYGTNQSIATSKVAERFWFNLVESVNVIAQIH